MKSIIFALGHLLLIRGDIEAENEESESDIKKTVLKEELINSEEADPFVSGLFEEVPKNDQSGLISNPELNLTSQDSGNGDSNLKNSDTTELNINQSESNEIDSKNNDNKEISDKDANKLNSEKSNTPGSLESLSMAEEKNTNNELFGIGKRSEKPVSKYWTEVLIDNKPKNILVNNHSSKKYPPYIRF